LEIAGNLLLDFSMTLDNCKLQMPKPEVLVDGLQWCKWWISRILPRCPLAARFFSIQSVLGWDMTAGTGMKAETEEAKLIGYCMKCRLEQMISDVHTLMMENGRSAMEGKCPDCGTRMYRLGKQ
jgi:hypothetical protein